MANTNKGWIKLHRQLLAWEWANEPLTVALFVRLLLMAGNCETPTWRYRGKEFKAGQLVTSVAKLAEDSCISPKCVRTRLASLEASGEIAIEAHTKYSIITINNYSEYQIENCGWANKGQTEQPEDEAVNTLDAPLVGKQRANKGQTKSAILGKQRANTSDYVTELLQALADEAGQTKGKQEGNIQEYILYIISSLPIEVKDYIIKNITKDSSNTNRGKRKKNAATPTDDAPQAPVASPDEANAPKPVEPTTAELEQMFEDFRKAYHGSKRGHDVELDNLKKKNPTTWRTIIPLLMPALLRMEEWRTAQAAAGGFVPEYAMMQTWINQKRWDYEYPATTTPKAKAAPVVQAPPTEEDYSWDGGFGSIDK